MNFDFNLDFEKSFNFDLEFTPEFESRYILPPEPKGISEQFLKYEYAEDLVKNLKLFPGCRYFVVVNGSFYFGDFIESLIVSNRLEVKRMTISTLSLNENNVDSLGNLLHDGYVKELNLIVSDYFFAHERANLIPYLYRELDFENRFQLAAARNHTKICIFETFCDARIVIHGSSNLRSSDNLEQLVLEDNSELYNWCNEWLMSILEKYQTINKLIDKPKSLRGQELWQAVADGKNQTANAAWQVQAVQAQREGEGEEPQTREVQPKEPETEQPEYYFE
jgi:hypothetical protein